MMGKLLLASVLSAAVGYLLGGIITGIFVSTKLYHDDVRTHGSGSAGMTNMLRNYGKLAAALTAIGDVGKGAVAVLIGRFIFARLLGGTAIDPVCGSYLTGIFAVLGHTKPVFFGFKGGKGVLVAGGAILATEPVVFFILLAVFLVQVSITRIVSLGSIILACIYPLLTLGYQMWRGVSIPTLIFCEVCSVIISAMVIYMHRSNIERLKNGTEYRFGQKK